MITMKDIAKDCGVSVSLVSKAINGYHDIKPDTKQKILESIERLGYVPNASASNLSKKKKNKIAVIVRGYRGDGKDLFIDEISMIYSTASFKRAIEKKVDVVILYDDIILGKTTDQIINHLKALGVNGIVMFGLNKNEDELYSIFKSNVFKKVIIDVPIFNTTTSSVSIDDINAQIDVLDYSLSSAIKNVIYLSGPKYDITSSQRLLGAKYYFKNHDISYQVIHCDYELGVARDIILTNPLEKIDAIICANDMMAIGAHEALKQLNSNILITGFDGINALKLIDKSIATVDQNFHNKALLAVDELINLLNGEEPRMIIDDYQVIMSHDISLGIS